MFYVFNFTYKHIIYKLLHYIRGTECYKVVEFTDKMTVFNKGCTIRRTSE